MTTDPFSPAGGRGRAVRLAAAALAGVLLLAGLAAMARRNLGFAGMWWDESASFWGSQGLSRYAEPFAARRGWRDTARMNTSENLDPGGHTVLLRLWTTWGTGIVHLRFLSLLFLLSSCGALAVLGWFLTRSLVFAVAAGTVPLLYPAARYFAFEIRAYGMEMAGVAVAALLAALAAERPTTARLAALGVACGAFLSSRYSFALVVAAVAVALAWTWLRRGDGAAATTRRLALAALPVAVSAGAIGLGMLRYQVWREMRPSPLRLAAPAYTRAAVLADAPDPLALLHANLLAPAALPLTLAIALFLAWRGRDRRLPAAIAALYAMVTAAQALSAAASALGAYPWDLRSRWSAYLVMVSAVAAVSVAADLVAVARARLARSAAPSPWTLAMPAAGAAATVLVAALAAAGAAGHRQATGSMVRADIPGQLDRLPVATLPERSVLVTFYEVPVVRYLYEHGPYRGRPEYPRLFRFESEAQFWEKQAIGAARDEIRFVITGRTPAEVQARLPGSRLAPVEPGSRLLAVVWARAAGPAPAAPAGAPHR